MKGKKEKRLSTSIIIIAVLLILIALLGYMVRSKAERIKQQELNSVKEEKTLINVITMEIIPGPVQEIITLPGQAKPWKSLVVVTEVRGKIMNKKAIEGKSVRPGDTLAVIDQRDYENRYNAAAADYETKLATEKRLAALKKKKYITQSKLDNITGMVKQARASMDNAKLNLSRCIIKSPMAGIINKVFIEKGTFLDIGKPVAEILSMDKIKIEVGIPESDVNIVRKLNEFDIEINALNSRHFKGKKHYLYKTTNDLARLYNLEIRVGNKDGMILPGMFARVKITKHFIKNGIAVPMYALVNKDGQDGVYIVSNGIAAFKRVEKGFLDKWRIQIRKGINPSDRVVVAGQRLISHGAKVKVVKNIKSMEELSQ